MLEVIQHILPVQNYLMLKPLSLTKTKTKTKNQQHSLHLCLSLLMHFSPSILLSVIHTPLLSDI